MKKKFKLLIILSTLCLAVSALCFGVWAVAKQTTYQMAGSLSYKVDGAYVEVNTKIFKSPEFMSASDLTSKVYGLANVDFRYNSNFTTKGLQMFVPDTKIDPYSSNAGSDKQFTYDKLDLEFKAGQRTFFIVINVKNLSETTNVWAVVQDEFNLPDNVLERNNGIQQTISSEDKQTKNIVIGVTVDNPAVQVYHEPGNFNFGIDIGIDNYATSERNLNKLVFNDVRNSITIGDMESKGVLVVPSMVDGVVYDRITAYSEKMDKMGRISIAPGLHGQYSHLIIEEGITTIEQYEREADRFSAVSSPLLYSIELPSTLTNYKDLNIIDNDDKEYLKNPLDECGNLDRIKVSEENPYLYSDETCRTLFVDDEYSIKYLICGTSSGYIPTFGDDEIQLVARCFANKKFTEIFIPKEVMDIGYNNFDGVSEGAFKGCPDLKVTFEQGSHICRSDYAGWTFGCRIKQVVCSDSYVGSGKVLYTIVNGKITFPTDEWYIGLIIEYSHPELILEIEITSDITELTSNDISGLGMYNLQEIVIPSTITSIGEDTFNGCVSLGSVVIENNNISIGARAFQDCPIENVVYETSDGYYTFKDGVLTATDPDTFDGDPSNEYYHWPELVLDVNFGTISYIGANGLQDFINLKQVNIPSTVVSINEYAFYNCKNLQQVNIPSSVLTIGQYAFKDCKILQKVAIGNSNVSISDGAFDRCESISEVNFSCTEVGVFAFDNGSLVVYDTESDDLFAYQSWLPLVLTLEFANNSNVISIGDFSDCCNMITLVIPDSVESISSGAFKGCDKLNCVTFQTSDTITLHGDVFSKNVKTILLEDSDGVEQKWTRDDGETYYFSTGSSLGKKYMNADAICGHKSGTKTPPPYVWTVCPA